MSEKIPLKELLTAVDQNVRELWDLIDDDQRKALKKEFFILNRYISNVKGQSTEVQEHFVLAVNEYFNKNWNDLQQHPKLLWNLLCLCGHESQKAFFHEWIKLERKAGGGNKKQKFLQTIFPNYKFNDIEVLSTLMADKEMKQLAKDHGWDDKQIKEYF
jgi:hypothetical protein